MERASPVTVRVFHDQFDEYRYQESKDRRSVADLGAIDRTFPGRSAMHQLIAQDIRSDERDAEHPCAVASLKSLRKRSPRYLEPLLPVRESIDPVTVLPDRVEGIAVFEKQTDRS